MKRIAGAVELMESGIDQWKQKFEKKKSNQIHLDKKGLELFKNQEGVLWNLIKRFGFNLDQCGQIINASHGQSGKRFFSTSFELVIDRDHIIISKIENEITETIINLNQTEAALGNFKMKIEKKGKVEFKNDSLAAFFDADKLKFPLRWRKWEPGDSFHPLGMDHKKKLSDFLIDQKISVADKEAVTVLESDNEIVWLVGLRIDDRYKVTGTTKSTAIFQVSTVV
jgi:tRNA(Ile)-lysidine synthase